jgi:hypothetical protein
MFDSSWPGWGLMQCGIAAGAGLLGVVNGGLVTSHSQKVEISKQRNKHIQQVLVEAARLAPRYSLELALLLRARTAAREQQSGHQGILRILPQVPAGRPLFSQAEGRKDLRRPVLQQMLVKGRSWIGLSDLEGQFSPLTTNHQPLFL